MTCALSLPTASCKVIKTLDEHEKAISESEVTYERSDGSMALSNSTLSEPQVLHSETSINYSNPTSAASNITHM